MRSPTCRRSRREKSTKTSCSRLKAAHAALTPKVQDLREVSEWQRWANVGIQEQLCEKMEALRNEADPEAIARRIHDLQQQWRLAADVPRPQGEALWRRFKTAHDELWVRCEAHFAAQAEQRAENLTKKSALCERVEALADSSNWVQTAEEIKGLQAQWKAIGPVTRGQEKAIWERFRAACDRFFTRRQDDLVKRKAMWAENFGKKEALCLKVEALAESTDWEQTASAIRALQAEWKTIGPVKKSRSDAIWQRFRAGCDTFFTRYAQRHDVARAERVAAREAICVELEALVRLSARSGDDAGGATGRRRRKPSSLRRTSRPLFGRCGTAGNRSWRHAASIATRRPRSIGVTPTPAVASSCAGRRASRGRIWIRRRIAAAWRRW